MWGRGLRWSLFGAVAVAQFDEVILHRVLGVTEHEGECRAGRGAHLHAYVYFARDACDGGGAVAVDAAIPWVGGVVLADVIDKHVGSVGDVEGETRLVEILV